MPVTLYKLKLDHVSYGPNIRSGVRFCAAENGMNILYSLQKEIGGDAFQLDVCTTADRAMFEEFWNGITMYLVCDSMPRSGAALDPFDAEVERIL